MRDEDDKITGKNPQDNLLWRVAAADRVLRPVEIETVKTLCEKESPVDENELVSATMDDALEKADLPAVNALNTEQKKQLTKLLWMVAVCDNELHPNEQELINKLCNAIGIDPTMQSSIQDDVIKKHLGKMNFPSDT